MVDGSGALVTDTRRPTPRGGDALIDVLAEIFDELESEAGALDVVGVGVPGLITTTGVLRSSPNIPDVIELDVAGRLGARLDRQVVVGNDATGAALAEWRVGAGRGVDDMVMVTLGTGIGGGVVAGGRLIVGSNGFTGEFGHMVVDPDGPPCPCGRRGCWERYASGSGLAQLARTAAVGGRLRTRVGGRRRRPGVRARRARPGRCSGGRPRRAGRHRGVRPAGWRSGWST